MCAHFLNRWHASCFVKLYKAYSRTEQMPKFTAGDDHRVVCPDCQMEQDADQHTMTCALIGQKTRIYALLSIVNVLWDTF